MQRQRQDGSNKYDPFGLNKLYSTARTKAKQITDHRAAKKKSWIEKPSVAGDKRGEKKSGKNKRHSKHPYKSGSSADITWHKKQRERIRNSNFCAQSPRQRSEDRGSQKTEDASTAILQRVYSERR